MLEVPVEPTPYAIKVKVGAKDIERQESSNRDQERQPRFFNISGSPYSVQKLIVAQGLDAYLGTPNHRKRKMTGEGGQRARKRQRRSETDTD
jgi:hypothetical protein